MFRSWFRIGLIFLIALCVALLAYWNQPYDRHANHGPYQITDVTVRRDASFCWVDVTVKGPTHSSSTPPFAYLLSAMEERIEHADLRMTEDQQSILLRFWMEQSKLTSAWDLSINDQKLRLRILARFPSMINNNAVTLPHAGTDMKYLLIDNSNTRTKFQLADAEHLHDWKKWIPTAEVNLDSLEEITDDIHFDAVLICSVVPTKSAIMQEFFSHTHPLHIVSCDSVMELTIDYPNPRQIGADRLANAVGVLEKYQVPAIVIDFGTAVTFDVISAQRAYCGGVIAPGLGAMNEYLHRKTALLPLIELAEPAHAVGKSTQEAMMAGAVYGYRGLVKEILLKLREEVEGDVTIIATGGDAASIAQGVEEIHLVDSQITLEGLRHLAMKNL